MMASNVKRFITFSTQKILFFLFLGLLAFQVKAGFAKSVKDEVISLHPPFELTLKKAGSVRLAGLLYEANSDALEKVIQVGATVRVNFLSETPDKYGRKPVHLYDQEGRWLQGELVRQGIATPYPYIGETKFIRDLYFLEKPIATPALSEEIPRDQFSIITGTVVAVANIKGTTYVNFGDNWRTDFTIRISKAKAKAFRALGVDPSTFKGKTIRIRGWVIEQNGPMIDANHPTQIEMIAN